MHTARTSSSRGRLAAVAFYSEPTRRFSPQFISSALLIAHRASYFLHPISLFCTFFENKIQNARAPAHTHYTARVTRHGSREPHPARRPVPILCTVHTNRCHFFARSEAHVLSYTGEGGYTGSVNRVKTPRTIPYSHLVACTPYRPRSL